MPHEAIPELLATYGVAMAPSLLVTANEAIEAAEQLGYPVAVKAVRRRVGRSVEAGVALDLSDRADVEEAVGVMLEHLGDDASQVLVQPMMPPGLDLRIHVTVDDRIGPVITAGLGGVQADVIADESSRLAPISPSVARSLIEATRAATALDDEALEQVADMISRVAQLASDHPEIAELDLNPVIVGDDGCRVTDATVLLHRPERPDPAVRRLE
jgi:succinyl-CoA synthetase beta subunit